MRQDREKRDIAGESPACARREDESCYPFSRYDKQRMTTNPGWFSEYGGDFVSFTLCSVLLVVYHVYLGLKLRKQPEYTIQAVNWAAHRAWVEGIMGDPERSVLAVQTLRNSTMAATFLASTAVLLIIGTLTLSGQADKLATAFHTVNIIGSHHPELWIFKLMLMVSNFFVAFFAFSMAIRLYNHVGYQINVPAAIRPKNVSPAKVTIHLNRAGNYYSIGMRAYYFAVPLVFWLFGPQFMVLATLVLIAVLYHIDRVPKSG
jgi:uncharacterized membrane protein